MEKASIGRMVHVVLEQPSSVMVHRPATVTSIDEGGPADFPPLNLHVLVEPGDLAHEPAARTVVHLARVPYHPTGEKPGTWHWPERV